MTIIGDGWILYPQAAVLLTQFKNAWLKGLAQLSGTIKEWKLIDLPILFLINARS